MASPFPTLPFVAILSLFLTSNPAYASIHIYTTEPFREVGNAFLLAGGSEGLAASLIAVEDASVSSFLHDGRSFIRFENITFWRTKAAADGHRDMENSTGLVQVVIFEAADRNNIGGSAYGGQRSICCTSDLAKLEGCKKSEVIRMPPATDISWPIVLNVQFNGNYLYANMDNVDVPITKTGMYNLFFIACDPKLKGLVMSGKTLWKNPDGYLPGRMAPLMNFYVYMSLAYVVLSVFWFIQYLRFWKDILQLQHCITAVITLGLFEMILWYFEYANFNNTGMRLVVVTTWVVTIGAIRKTLSRLLILCVSMGYGVVRPTLGGLTSKVLLLGVTYFLASELLDITEYVGTISDVSGRARLFLVLPDAFLDAFLILWTFTALSKTLEQLQVYFKATDPFNERWQSAWIITAFWDVIAFVLLCVICYLWAPSQNSQRYAYSEEVGEEFDEETQSLTRGKSEGDLNLVKQEKKENDIGNADVFDEDDKEEDKRE
ncbi:transmembrane protein 87B isoform X2 [Pistacia vera]|uniref:transmembrane protein 87B isoform X2 n=1 Tax=Pistacia vera TaxID=55513 RepID=UPI001262C3AD|nr:transmembrane protein 87B isoform X2 [Pistacia vera]